MKTERIGAIAVLAAGVALAGCGEADGMQTGEASSEPAVRTMNVEVVRVQPQAFTHFVRVVGTVEAERDVTVAAEEGGVVEALLARKGERVPAGAALVKIDDTVLQAQLDQAESQAALARETWERQKRLWEQDSVGTEIQYLQARTNAETAAAQVRVLRERVSRTSVRAPVGGLLDDRLVEVGSMVSPGTPVGRVLDVDTVKVVAGVPERYAPDIEAGAEVRVSVDALAGRQYAGRVDFVGAAVDRDNRTFEVEVVVPNPGLGIKPGMVANVQIARRTIEGALAVPRHAVLRREAGYVVFVARETANGPRAAAQPVDLGVTRGDYVVVREGLEAGDRVVTVGQQQIAEGDRLAITAESTVSTPAATVATGGEG
jgi:RND family efflux transporter MFP subunit